MNEDLIQKLVDQCVDKRERHGTTVEVLQSRKFAELIVRECIFAVEDAGGINKYHYTKAISKHFGVEE